MQKNLLIEPKWIASLYALSATAVCMLIFTYSQISFLDALLKTFFTSIAFYFMGIITSSLVNFIVINFSPSKPSKKSEINELTANEKSS